ncbi:MmgE/PrpD family protein [Rhodococcus sp. NPDC127530]|uniref:MmgE/PrpD family protein n=1 Tax=unclassified Rhodococcus (in: high G+C Gram-positive bacteria) TaxID=192944 RepID=UPI003644CB3F
MTTIAARSVAAEIDPDTEKKEQYMSQHSDGAKDKLDLASTFADFISGLSVAKLDAVVVDAVKANILDTLACAVSGSTAPAVDVVRDIVDEWGGAPQADAWVFGGRYPAHHAAWLNSAMAHARDYDDTHDAAILHAGISSVPAALASAQLNNDATGEDVLSAVAAGLEITCRLGTAIRVDIVESGFIYSSLLGYFGAAAAASRALRLSAEQTWDALGIVYSSVAGNHQVTRDASLMKRLQPGLAAQAGVVAAQLAKRGIRGPRNIFEGADGFFRIYLQDRVDVTTAKDGLGTRFEMLNLSYKPYPCCRDTHSAVDAALEIRNRTGRSADEIASIKVGVTGPGYQMVCVPEEVRRAPKTIVEAQFSIPYTVAAAWVDNGLSIENFSVDGIGREEVLALTRKVVPFVEEDIDRDWHRFVTPALVIVEFTDGSVVESRIDYPKGHPKNPMTSTEITSKTADCVAFAAKPLNAHTPARLKELVESLDSGATIDELVRTLLAVTHEPEASGTA